MKFWLEYAKLSGPADKAFEEDLSPQKSLEPTFVFRIIKKDLLEDESNGVVAALHTKKLSDEVHKEKVLPFKTLRRLTGCI